MERAGKFVDILTHFVYRYTLQTIILVLGVALALYAFLHFGVSASMVHELEETNHDMITNEIEYEITLLNHQLDEIEEYANLLHLEYNNFYERMDTYELTEASFAIHDNGSYYKSLDNGGSSLYYSMITPLTEYAIEKANKTEALDPIMKYLVDDNELIVQSYLNTFDNMTRIYPYRQNLSEQLGPDIQIDTFNFYYLADELHNPSRASVWTPPYYDPAGQGWIVSCIKPVYRNDFLEGVTGVDVTIDNLVAHTLIDYNSDKIATIIIDKTGLIIATNGLAEELIQIERLKKVISGRVTSDILKPDSYNIYRFGNSEVKDKLVKIFEDNLSHVEFQGHDFHVVKHDLDITDWTMITLTPEDYIFDDIKKINRKIYLNLLIIVIVLLLMIFIIALFYKSKIKKMAKRVSEPLEHMMHSTKNFAINGQDILRTESSGILEVDLLSRELFFMSKAIHDRNNKILKVQIENQKAEKTIEVYHKDSITDKLTQVYNRRKIDDVIDSEVKRCKRYGKPFSVILMDVDYFKEINDVHGHQTGDKVLMQFAQVISHSVRESDVVSRWGGDEFLIVVIESDEIAAYNLAEKIRLNVASNEFDQQVKVTTSIGVANFDHTKDDAREIIRKADIALYEAKSNGRNNVVTYTSIGDINE